MAQLQTISEVHIFVEIASKKSPEALFEMFLTEKQKIFYFYILGALQA